jgi:hypothetical protein
MRVPFEAILLPELVPLYTFMKENNLGGEIRNLRELYDSLQNDKRRPYDMDEVDWYKHLTTLRTS